MSAPGVWEALMRGPGPCRVQGLASHLLHRVQAMNLSKKKNYISECRVFIRRLLRSQDILYQGDGEGGGGGGIL